MCICTTAQCLRAITMITFYLVPCIYNYNTIVCVTKYVVKDIIQEPLRSKKDGKTKIYCWILVMRKSALINDNTTKQS